MLTTNGKILSKDTLNKRNSLLPLKDSVLSSGQFPPLKTATISTLSFLVKQLKLAEICEAIDNTGTFILIYLSLASVLIPISSIFLIAIEGAQAMLDKSSPRQFGYNEHIIPKYFGHSKTKLVFSVLLLPFLCMYEIVRLAGMLLLVEWDSKKLYPQKLWNMLKKNKAKIFAWGVLGAGALCTAMVFFAAWYWLALRFGWEKPFVFLDVATMSLQSTS